MTASTAIPLRQYHEALRKAGLRPIRIWVPDTKRTGFAEECRRQSLLLRDDQQERETIAWLENVADHEGWK